MNVAWLDTVRLTQAKHILKTLAGARPAGWRSTRCDDLGDSRADRDRHRVTATLARHGPEEIKGAVGDVTGWIVEWDGQRRGALYISGDTVLFEDMEEIGRLCSTSERLRSMCTARSISPSHSDTAGLERSSNVSKQLQDAGIENTITANVKTEIWKKLILNAATLPTSSLTGLRVGELGQQGPMLDLVDALAAEAVNVARMLGYDIELEERIERIHAVLNGGGAGKSSMLQDVEARRKTEIEVINGAVLQAAEREGIDVPLNRAMVALIGGLERSWSR